MYGLVNTMYGLRKRMTTATRTPTITKDDVDAALQRIRRHVHETPLVSSTRLGDRAGGIRLMLKCELFQRTGSFKARGALNAMMQLSDAERAKGVVAVSAGNHAQALAWAASTVGSHAVAVMPAHAPVSKIEATKGYGGRVELVNGEMIRAFQRAEEIAAEGRVMIHPFAHPHVAAGQGTAGLEILSQARDLDAVVIPIGGGGLIAGVATAIKAVRPDVRVIGVEPEGAPTMRRSLDAGSPQTIPVKTVADGLMAPTTAEMNLDIVKRLVADVVLVSDDEIVTAMRDLLANTKLVVEPAAAAGVAALLSGKIRFDRGANVVAILTGGNVDLERLKTLL
jgi:threonine dehydratase